MVSKASRNIALDEAETQALLDWAAEVEQSNATYLEKAQKLATRLGAHYRPDGKTEIGFWTPELLADVMLPRDIYLEILTPISKIDFRAIEQEASFVCSRLRLRQQGEYLWGVIDGLVPGRRDQAGSFYWLRYLDNMDTLRTIRDVVAYSLPYGVFGPAELYDIEAMHQERADLDYFRQTSIVPAASESTPSEPVTPSQTHISAAATLGTAKSSPATTQVTLPRVPAPVNILQIHVGTATEAGSLEGLNQLFQGISAKLAAGEPLTAAEQNYVGYDAVQLLPIEPTIEYRSEHAQESNFFALTEMGVSEGEATIQFKLYKPNTEDWGYDIPGLAASAINPAVMATLRPDELIDLIATLHNFATGPVQLIYDIVYGHADNQAEELINRQFLKGPNMYGQDLNHQQPTVRAILLEMQRRKINTGCDGIRIDGAQDFRFFNPLTGRVEQDNVYLLAMADVVQNICGYERLMFTVFEDGRPWPEEGWEETSTYRDMIELMPDAFQWGPLIFAHNTPTLAGFWESKWRRVCEVMYQGDRWITGCANHDTIRRGSQVDPKKEINWNLGETLPEVLDNAYDNHAVTLWVYGFSPGLPMDFINATMHAPWMFFRNTDERYGVKVVSEEMGFLYWQVDEELYQRDHIFSQLKELGFANLDQLREFGQSLQDAMTESDYNLNEVVRACQRCLGDEVATCEIDSLKELNRPGMIKFLKELDITQLKEFSIKFMEDCYEVCNVHRYLDRAEPIQAEFNLQLRQFRHQRPWLLNNLSNLDRFNKISGDDRTIFYGVRSNPDDAADKVAMVAHMGGAETTITLGDWLQLDLNKWQLAIASPGLEVENTAKSLRRFQLKDSQGLLLVRKPDQTNAAEFE
ncbi:glucosylglycerol hydrolase [Thalassoporum mexicanum]|uniref:glucosylglycerol hydrolase n=1 Tax=Thalassoporum mexicanum TaxID=3457544 RepID=UPI0005A15CCD